MIKGTRDLEDWIIGKIYEYHPRLKGMAGCKTYRYPHPHVEDAYGNFTICTETYDYKQMGERARYEAEHDL